MTLWILWADDRSVWRVFHSEAEALCECPFAITTVIIPHFPSMSTVLEKFFRHLNQIEVSEVEYISIFLCILHLSFFIFPLKANEKKESPCEVSPKTKTNRFWFCAIERFGKIKLLHPKQEEKRDFLQEIVNNSWIDGNFVLFFKKRNLPPQLANSTRHLTFLLGSSAQRLAVTRSVSRIHYNIKNPNSTYLFLFLSIILKTERYFQRGIGGYWQTSDSIIQNSPPNNGKDRVIWTLSGSFSNSTSVTWRVSSSVLLFW